MRSHKCSEWILASGWMLLAIGLAGSVSLADEPQETTDGDRALVALKAELEEASRIQRKKYQEATSDEERAELQKNNSYRQFEPKYLQFARKYAGQPAAMEAAKWLVETANPGANYDGALALIGEHHLDDEGVAEICRTVVFRLTPAGERFLRTVGEKHPDRAVRGVAYLSLARHQKQRYDRAVYMQANEGKFSEWAKRNFSDEVIAWYRAADPVELSGQVDALCEKIIMEYADVVDEESTSDAGNPRTLADAARGVHFSLHAVGSLAPEIAGKGADGTPIRLSDYRGKVVVLMFSADWCGPCKEMYGQLRELTKLYADRPFSVITVRTDEKSETVLDDIQSGEVAWPAIWDGAEGPIASDWYVTSWPTIYLIDGDGRIKSRDLREDPLDDEVAALLGIDPESRVKVDKRTRAWRLSLKDQKLTGAELPKLLEGYTELRHLDLSDNPLADEALIHILPLTKLQRIDLTNTGITDQGLLHLRNLPNLKVVLLYFGPGSTVSNSGMRELREAIPGLKTLITTHR